MTPVSEPFLFLLLLVTVDATSRFLWKGKNLSVLLNRLVFAEPVGVASLLLVVNSFGKISGRVLTSSGNLCAPLSRLSLLKKKELIPSENRSQSFPTSAVNRKF